MPHPRILRGSAPRVRPYNANSRGRSSRATVARMVIGSSMVSMPVNLALCYSCKQANQSCDCLVPGAYRTVSRVTENLNPSVRSRQVANLLRQLREDAGLTGAEVARQLGISASKSRRIETSNRLMSIDVVATLLGLYPVPQRQREEIIEQVRKSAERGWWESQGLGLPELWKALIDFESRATRIQNYEALVIPGLLQTAEYTGVIIKSINQALTEAELTNLVASRMARQAVLRRQDLQFLAIIDEGALRRPIAE